MSVDVLVLSVDEAHLLRHSLPAAASQEGASVVVVDNACTDGTAEVAARAGARVVRLDERRTYAAAINAGLATCTADAVLLLNADCVLDEGFLAAALPRLSDSDVGMVAGRLLRATGMTAADRLDEIDAAAMVVDRRRKNTLVGHGEPSGRYADPGDAFGPDGACALLRRETLRECAIDGEVLDEDLALWASDVDLMWRARLLGWRCVYEPAALAWHVRTYSPSTRARVDEAHRRLQYRNRFLMMVKNDRRSELLRDAPLLIGWEMAALGHVLLRERHLLAAYRDAWRLRGAALARRRALKPRWKARAPLGLRPPRAE